MMSSSKGKEEGDKSPSEEPQWKQHLPTDVVKDLLCLVRIRDFLCLILSYPMRIGIEKYLKEWINEFMRFSADNSEQMAIALLDDKNMSLHEEMLLSDSFQREVKLLLSTSPLKYVEGLIPKHIITDIINGDSFIFNASNTSEKQTAATSSVTQLKHVPDLILHLATHLAVQQLFQTLSLELNIQNVMFSTRDVAEKQMAVEKMVKGFGEPLSYYNLKYWGVIVLNDTNNQDDDKQFQVLDPEVRRWLEQIMGTKLQKNDDSTLLARERKRNIVVVVDGDGDKKLDLSKVRFPKRENNRDVVVFITTETKSSALEMDLVIRTEDHVLPWEVFCKNVGSELVLRASSGIQRIAVKIVEACGGHLLAILLVAKSLHNVEDFQLWRLALEKLRYPNLIYRDVKMRRVQRRNRGTYYPRVLENAFINIIWVDVIFETKKPRLSRCLRAFKSQHYLMMGDEELFKIWLSEKLVDSQKEAEHTLRELIDCSILLQFVDTSGSSFLLPEEIRDILEALLEENIHYGDLRGEESGLRVVESTNVWHWHGAVRIFLMNKKISKLPQSPNCPRLKELYLNGNANLMKISSSFFQHMPLLQFLDLSHTGIRDLPSSIFKLAHLKTLYLRECKEFNQLPPEIEQLTNLENLHLDGTPFTPKSLNLPKLTSLSLGINLDLTEIPSSFFQHMPLIQVLDLSNTGIQDLPSSIFKLAHLKTLYLRECKHFNQLPPEIEQLTNLENLNLAGTPITNLPESLNLPKLRSLFLGGNFDLMEISSSFFQYMLLLQVLDLSNTGIRHLPSSIFKLAHLKTLNLRECKQFNQLLPKIEQLTNLEDLNLHGTSITNLPHSLNLPKLKSLFLGSFLDLIEIPPNLFDHMPRLTILDLSCTSIHDLPSSFFNLEELMEFYLKDCEIFIELPPQIGRLRKLKNLDLDGTQITHLPKEIEVLTNLESLSLAFSGYHRNSGHGKKSMPSFSSAMIPLGFIQKLTHLKYLKIDVNPDNEWWHNNVEHILAEIAGLRKLQTLELYIPEVKLLKFIPRLHLSTLRLIIGHHTQRIISRVPPAVEVKFKQSNRSLRFVNGADFPDEVKNILGPGEVVSLFLDRHMTINHLTEFGLKNLRYLELCILGECNEMQSIVDEDEMHRPGLFNLEFLTIFYMKNLRSIVRPTLPWFSFCGLKFLAFHTCPELTTILAQHFLESLFYLEEVIVEDCPKVCSLITSQSSTPTEDKFLPRLRKLLLLHLPELVTISNGLHIGESLDTVGFYDCPKLISLSSMELSSKTLKVIRGEINWWEALKWNEEEWGPEGRPHKFSQIFSEIDEDLDVLTQLTA